MKLNLENYETWMIDYIEGNLSSEQVETLKQFIRLHPELNAELEIFEETILKPDQNVVFQNKALLKKQEPGKVIAFHFNTKYIVGIAAALLLFIGIQTFMKPVEYTAKEIQTKEINEPKFAFEQKQEIIDSIKIDTPNNTIEDTYYAQTKKKKQDKVDEKKDQQLLEENKEEMNLAVKDLIQVEEMLLEVELASNQEIELKTTQPKLKKLQSDLSANNYADILGYKQNEPETIIDKYYSTKAFAESIGNIFGFTQEKNSMEDDYKETSIKIFNIEFYNGKKIN